MTESEFSPRIREIIRDLSGDERSMSIALGAIIREADGSGSAEFHRVAIRYRDEFLRALRADGKDAERDGPQEAEVAACRLTVVPGSDGVRRLPEGDGVFRREP